MAVLSTQVLLTLFLGILNWYIVFCILLLSVFEDILNEGLNKRSRERLFSFPFK